MRIEENFRLQHICNTEKENLKNFRNDDKKSLNNEIFNNVISYHSNYYHRVNKIIEIKNLKKYRIIYTYYI